LTPQYLERGRAARDELALLVKEYRAGLKLLPVLVEECAWETVEPELAQVQFARWQNSTVPPREGERAKLRALKYAGDDEAIEGAVLDVCRQVGSAMGAAGQTTSGDRDRLMIALEQALADKIDLEEAVHIGDFSIIYRGKYEGETVAVKAIPDAVRKNRMRASFACAVESMRKLRDPAFIELRFPIFDEDAHTLVMEYITLPTLDDELCKFPGRRLPPRIVAKILSVIARAQGDAHRRANVEIGLLSAASIYVDAEWDVRLTPVRIEGQLARAAGLISGRHINWNALASVTPEIWDGLEPTSVAELDRHEQYYLGLLGLELLLGRRPFEIRRFDDLSRFFDNPRAFFDDDTPGAQPWTEEDPALAFLLLRFLARDPAGRLPSAERAAEDLKAVANGELPESLRQQLADDLKELMGEDFTGAFYKVLLESRPQLKERLEKVDQAAMLARALRDLADFRPTSQLSRFDQIAQDHAGYGISAEDVHVFRSVFLEQVAEVCAKNVCSRHAWAAALDMGLGAMAKYLAAAQTQK
jgi:serine/threonine protein kinase